MTVVWVLLAAVVVVVVARALQGSRAIGVLREPRPGEDIARPATHPVADLVDLGEYDHEEATIVYGLLDSNGIAATLRTASGSEALTAYRMVPRRLRVLVDADRVDEARALLAPQPETDD